MATESPTRVCTVGALVVALFALAPAAARAAPAYLLQPEQQAPATPEVQRPEHVQAPRGLVARRHILVKLERGADVALFRAQAEPHGLGVLGRVYGSEWLRVSIPEGLPPHAAAAAAAGFAGVRRATPDPILRIDAHSPIAPHDPFYLDDDDPTTKNCDPLVQACQTTEIVDQWGLFQVEAEGGWSEQTGSDQVIIAVLDSGVDLDHDDLVGKTVLGWDFVGDNIGDLLTDNAASQDANPDVVSGGDWVQDLTAFPLGWRFVGDPAVGDAVDNDLNFTADVGVFHGTFVAGIAAALTDNLNPDTGQYEGMAGACQNCKIMPVRMINAEGWAFSSDGAEAIRWAADHGADVINTSWGIDIDALDASAMAEVQLLREAVEYAVSQGVIFVAAAGNSGDTGVHFPAVLPDVIAVGSSDWLDARSVFSSYGTAGEVPDNGIDDDGNGWTDDVVDVIAPGELIWSTTVVSAYESWLLNGWLFAPEFDPSWFPGDDAYTRVDGTSFATPLVAGYVGLLLSENPGATLGQVRDALRANALDVHGLGYDPESGFGRVRFVVPGGSTPAPEPAPNQAPVADAGAAQSIQDEAKPGQEPVTLDGTGSFDPDGAIVTYRWSADGALLGTGEVMTVTLPTGTHTIDLRVTDDRGATDTDSVVIEVLAKKSGNGSGKPGKGNAKKTN